jgi:hypothetical protein
MKTFIFLLASFVAHLSIGFAQQKESAVALKYYGERHITKGKTISNSKAYIILNPDSLFEQKIYINYKNSSKYLMPNVETGFWIKKKSFIYLYPRKVFNNTDWNELFKVRKNSIRFLYRRYAHGWKQNISKSKRKERFNNIFGVYTVIIYNQMK